ADESARGTRARKDQLDDTPHRKRLVQPGERGRVVGHVRAAVADDDDLRRLLCKALADEELVAAPGRRETCGGRPVDRIHVVAGAIRPRPGNVPTRASTETPH